uniref:Ankyrin repeat domain 28 n=1 Tax=Homo sapiens TaxID=9606 RepID=F8WDU2_HUMAN
MAFLKLRDQACDWN